jgi:hypothetical protein
MNALQAVNDGVGANGGWSIFGKRVRVLTSRTPQAWRVLLPASHASIVPPVSLRTITAEANATLDRQHYLLSTGKQVCSPKARHTSIHVVNDGSSEVYQFTR